MTSRFVLFALLATILLTAVTWADDRPNERSPGPPDKGQPAKGRLDFAPVTLHVACGELFNAACARALPRISARTTQAGIVLTPVQSGGAIDTFAFVCQGQVAMAIVQRDAVALLARQPSCLDRYDIVGRPLYPVYGILVVKAGAPIHQLNEFARTGAVGGRGVIAAGPEGSSGQVTLDFLLRSDPELQREITVTIDDMDAALVHVADGSVDGFFTMVSLDSDVIDRIRLRKDASHMPLYAFVDVRPGSEFFRSGDGRGNCLYRLTALDFGGVAPITTISVDAVMVLGRTFHDVHARSGPRAFDTLSSAIDAAQPAILTDMRSPRDWRPAGTSCH